MQSVSIIRNEQFTAAAQEYLGQATRYVDVATYKFEYSKGSDARELNSLISTLYSLAIIDVRVRVLLHGGGRRTTLVKINEYAARELKKHKIQCRYLPDNRTQHAKLILVDKCIGIIGSHNWSVKSLVQNFEVSVGLYHAGYISDIQNHFDKIWEKAIKY